MIVAWGIFVLSLLLTLVWLTELVPRWSNCTNQLTRYRCMRGSMLNLLFWFLLALFSAQFIWG